MFAATGLGIDLNHPRAGLWCDLLLALRRHPNTTSATNRYDDATLRAGEGACVNDDVHSRPRLRARVRGGGAR